MLKLFRYGIYLCAIFAISGCVKKPEQPLYDNITVIDELVIDENSVPIFPKKAALTTDTARRFSIELPKRCEVDWNNQSVVSVVPSEKIEIVRLGVGDELPELQVSDYEFKDLTVKRALDKLLDGTDIAVVEDEPLYEKISGTISSGALSDAVELMAKMGRAYYSYDAQTGELVDPENVNEGRCMVPKVIIWEDVQ